MYVFASPTFAPVTPAIAFRPQLHTAAHEQHGAFRFRARHTN